MDGPVYATDGTTSMSWVTSDGGCIIPWRDEDRASARRALADAVAVFFDDYRAERVNLVPVDESEDQW